MPFFSVVIPTYNRKESLKKAIFSVLLQDEQNFELIIVDDGSESGSKEFLKEIAKQTNLRVFFIPTRKGVSFARNFGVQNAYSKWICFLDSDDLWHKKKLSVQKKFLQENPQYVIFQTQEDWIRNQKKINPPKKYVKKSGDIFSDCLQHCFITPSAVCLQKKIFLEFGGFDEYLPACEDYDLWVRITAKYSAGLIKEKLVVRFEGHQDQLSHTYQAMDRFRIYSLLKNIIQGSFSKLQTELAYLVLQKKVKIYLQGAKKRAKNTSYFKKIYQDFLIQSADSKNNHIKTTQLKKNNFFSRLRASLEIDLQNSFL